MELLIGQRSGLHSVYISASNADEHIGFTAWSEHIAEERQHLIQESKTTATK